MLKKIKEFFMGKPAEVAAPAPYKVETPSTKVELPEVAAITPTLSVVETQPVVEAVTAAPEKKTRKPRAVKAVTTAKEKAPAKAKAPKLTVVKAEKKTKSKKA